MPIAKTPRHPTLCTRSTPPPAAASQPRIQITWVHPISAPRCRAGANSLTRLVATGATPPKPHPARKLRATSQPSDGASAQRPVAALLSATVMP